MWRIEEAASIQYTGYPIFHDTPLSSYRVSIRTEIQPIKYVFIVIPSGIKLSTSSLKKLGFIIFSLTRVYGAVLNKA